MEDLESPAKKDCGSHGKGEFLSIKNLSIRDIHGYTYAYLIYFLHHVMYKA